MSPAQRQEFVTKAEEIIQMARTTCVPVLDRKPTVNEAEQMILSNYNTIGMLMTGFLNAAAASLPLQEEIRELAHTIMDVNFDLAGLIAHEKAKSI